MIVSIFRLWLYNIARGIDLEVVTPRFTSKSIGCCKKFPGRNAITGMSTLNHWLHELAKEMCERLEQDEEDNNRRPKQMVVSYVQTINKADVSSSRSININVFDEEKIVIEAIDILKKNTDKFYKTADNDNALNYPIKFLGISMGKFESTDTKRGKTIQDMFRKSASLQAQNGGNNKLDIDDMDNDTSESESNMDPLERVDLLKPDIEIKSITENRAPPQEKPIEVTTSDSNNTVLASKQNDIKKSFFANLQISRTNRTTTTVSSNLQSNDAPAVNSSTIKSPVTEKNVEEDVFHDDMLIAEMQENEQSMRTHDLPETSTKEKANYMDSYAEFYRPPQIVEEKVECPQCNKMVNRQEMQVHTDAHFAYELSQQQRAEFQSQLKQNTSVTSPPAKKQKINRKPSATNVAVSNTSNSLLIEKFLVKREDIALDDCAASTSEVATEKCSECGKSVPISEIQEHSDYHAARKLHQELMQSEVVTRPITNKNDSKKMPTNKTAKNQKNICSGSATTSSMKSITSFFQNN